MSKIFKILIVIVGLIILWLLTLYFKRTPIEQDLTNRAKDALKRPEFSQVVIAFDGRDGTLSGEVGSQSLADEAENLAKEIWGVRVIDNQLTVLAESQPVRYAALQGFYQDGKFMLTGVFPDESSREKFIQLAKNTLGGGNVVDQTSLDSTVQLPPIFEKALNVFLGLKGIEQAGFDMSNEKFILKGKVASEAIKTRLGAGLMKAIDPLAVENRLQVAATTAIKPTLKDLVKFFADNPIEFEFSSSELTRTARQKLDRAFELLRQVPEGNFVIEGHTDNIGTPEFNQRLSRARAIAVRLYLLEREIEPERLSITFFGETKPKASNDTEAGRRQNRRVEFRLK